MKEVTYGWYPPVKDIYRPKGIPSSDHLQCLYKFREYQGQAIVPQAELFVRGVSSTISPDLSQHLKRKSKSAPILKLRTESRINIPTPTQCWSKWQTQETKWGIVDDLSPETIASEVSWPIFQDGKQKQKLKEEKDFQQKQQKMLREHIQKQQKGYILEGHQIPQNAWGLRKSSQDSSNSSSEAGSRVAWPKALKTQPVRPQSSYSDQSRSHQETLVGRQKRPSSSPAMSSITSAQDQKDTRAAMTPRSPSRENSSSAKLFCRTQSATVRQEKIQLATRLVTAFSDRHLVRRYDTVCPDSVQHDTDERPPARSAVPTPLPNNIDDTASSLPVATVPPRSPSGQKEDGVDDDYETVVEKYGWRAQVHGDPYKLKNPMKRESYAVNCTAPDLPPDPPSIHIETKEPFFYNTIPKKLLSFTVDKEWMSEVLLAKRLELQKRDHGIRYNYKNFAFVY